MKLFGNIMLMATGAALGGWIVWNRAKEYYEEKTREAIQSVKDSYRTDKDTDDNETVDKTDEENEASVNKFVIESKDIPYEISDSEFGTRKNYRAMQLVLFSDGVVADDTGVIYREDDIGLNVSNLMTGREDEAIYIRNDEKHRDFEFICDAREYGEALFQQPLAPEDL